MPVIHRPLVDGLRLQDPHVDLPRTERAWTIPPLLRSELVLWGLAVIGATALVLLQRDRKRAAWIMLLPALWVVPLLLTIVFVESEDGLKSADWLGWLCVPMLVLYPLIVGALLLKLQGLRGFVLACACLNAPSLLYSVLIVAMASSGTYL